MFELAATGLDLAEEVRIMDFPGAEAIRSRITAARERGDDALVASLQVEHRRARMRAAGQSVTNGTRVPLVVTSGHVTRGVTWVQSNRPRNPMREIHGHIVGWGPMVTSTGAAEMPQVVVDIRAHDVREFVARCDPAAIPIRADHESEPVGAWWRFELDEVGLWSIGILDDSPAADEVLQACDDGAAGGLSFFGDLSHFTDTGQVRDGLRVFSGGPLEILEAGPAVNPSDDRCLIESVAGHVPLWRRRAAAVERDGLMRAMGIRR
jgi:hypothetical protein